MKKILDFLVFAIIWFAGCFLLIFFWNAKTPISYAQLEYACLEHRGDKSNFMHEVTCNDGQVVKNYDSIGNDWIYARSLEIKDFSFWRHTDYILSK